MSPSTTVRPYTNTKMPDCSEYKAFVLPGAFYGHCVALMAEAGFQKAESVNEADVVVFIGGEDIDPNLYGDKKHPTTSYSPVRDILEKTYYDQSVSSDKVMFGICRGAQFLHAMNGGKLWQDVDNHAGEDHVVVDIEENVTFTATSLHHQMLKVNDDLTVIAVTEEPVASRFSDGTMSVRAEHSSELEGLEIEAGCYIETGCFFVQGHPEIGDPEYRAWCMNKLYEFMIEWEIRILDGETIEEKLEIPILN